MQDKVVTKRLFVGGLASNVTSEELQERFSRFGKISNLSLKRRSDDEGNPIKSFAHLDVEGDENNIRKCFNTYQHTKWKGSVLELQYAKESFLSKLAKEREEETKIKTEPASNKNTTAPETKQSKTTPVVTEVKGVPGTPVPGKKDWVVGKYGRALPVLKLKKSYKIKMVKHDPSKFCHAAKVFKEDNKDSLSDASCEKLTWEINTPDSEITKKRKENFPKSQGKTEKNKKASVVLKKSLHTGDDAVETEKLFLNSVKVESNESEDLEIVKLETGISKNISSCKNVSNRFDSDVESDSRPENSNENHKIKKGKGKTKMTKISSATLSKIEKENVVAEGVSTKSKSKTQKSKEVVKTSTQSSIHSDKKIPAFKGLQMLGPSASFIKEAQEKIDVSYITDRKLQPDPSPSETGRTHRIDTFHSKAGDNNSAQQNKNTNAKSSVKHKQVTESGGNKFPTNSSVITTKKRVSPEDNEGHSTTKCPIPAFRGLEMLTDRGISSEASKTAKDLVETNFSVQGPKASAIKETTKIGEKRTVKAPKAQSSSSLFNLDLNDKEKPKVEDYDSSCSADTDELLTNYKQKKGLISTFPTSLSFRKKLKLAEEHLQDVSPHRVVDISIIDQNLSISEYIAGISEFAEKPERIPSGVHQDPYDSDLDSNDFALVARKLAQKAATSGKKAAEKHVPRDGQRQNSLKTTASKTSDPVVVEKKTDQDMNPKTRETKSALQSRLLDIANNKDGSDSLSEKASGQKPGLKKERSPANLSQSPTSNFTHSETKQATDNEKRLQAVKEKLKQKQQQQSLMQKALQNVDSSSSKRVVFDSSDSDENEDNNSGETASKTRSNKSSEKEDQSKLALFDSSSDEEDQEDNNYDKLFESKAHFEGKKGEKLMKLDRKIGDSRFKLDARFVESDSEEEVETQTDAAEKKDDSQKVLEEEKAASLKVLENVIGKTTLDRFSEKLKKNTKHIIDMNTVRFDPTKISSQQSQSFHVEKKVAKDKSALSQRSPSPDRSTRKEKRKVNQTQEVEKVPGLIKKETEDEISHVGKKRTAQVLAEETEQEAKKRKKTERMTQEQKQETIQETALEVTEPVKTKKEKPASKMSESNTSTEVNTSKASSKVQLAPSLIDWFKKKAKDDDKEEETAQPFSLLKQFDQDTEDKDQNDSMDEDSNLSEEADSKAAPQSKVPLSGLFSKAASQTGKLMGGEKTGLMAGAESSVDSTSEDNSEEESETESEQENSVRNIADDDEDGEKEDKRENEEQDESQIDPDMDLHKDLKNAGRVDVRFTKEQWLQRWEEIRPALIKTYKRKHKEALKNKRAQSEMKRRKAFLRNSKKGHWVRRKR